MCVRPHVRTPKPLNLLSWQLVLWSSARSDTFRSHFSGYATSGHLYMNTPTWVSVLFSTVTPIKYVEGRKFPKKSHRENWSTFCAQYFCRESWGFLEVICPVHAVVGFSATINIGHPDKREDCRSIVSLVRNNEASCRPNFVRLHVWNVKYTGCY
jgi:hypothetical protein